MNTVVFDMDGLLIDSEPLWEEAAKEIFSVYGVKLTPQHHATTTGLRTLEYVQWWFKYYDLDTTLIPQVVQQINDNVTEKIKRAPRIMPGVDHIFNFFVEKNFKIGLASSSPMQLIECVVDMIGVRPYLQAIASAGELPYGKPHPQVYLDCAKMLQSNPLECICFEDSFNGMIAAKSAKMKCVIVPHHLQYKDERWGAADLKLTSLSNFGDLHLKTI